MGRLDDESKQNRKELIFQAIQLNVEIKESELADQLGIDRRTLNNYLRELDKENRIVKEHGQWHVTDLGKRQLRQINVTPEQGMALYLAARSLARVQDERNEVVETAMVQLANAIRGDGVLGDALLQAATELTQRPERTGYNSVFRAMMQGYVHRRSVEITYSPANGHEFATTFRPYLFEPSLIGMSIYAIGHSSAPNAIRTYKLERIRSAELTTESYYIPSDFPGLDLLKTGWSGMFGEETQLVRLKFSPRVRERVLETHWHPSQHTDDDEDDPRYLIWEVKVADWLDMLPWIKGWGAEVEVMAPAALMAEMRRNARALAKLYGIVRAQEQDANLARLLRCWGKTTGDPEKFHPALFHMLDVGHVAQAFLRDEASPRWMTLFRRTFGWPDDMILSWIPFLVACHDLGKVSSSFAGLNANQKSRMQAEHFEFGKWTSSLDAPHSLIGQVVLARAITDAAVEVPDPVRKLAEEAIGGHHGEFARQQDLKQFRQVLRDGYEPHEWATLRSVATGVIARMFLNPALPTASEPAHRSGAVAALTGFTILCDWLGSDNRYFVAQPDEDLEAYIQDSLRHAQHAIDEAGFTQVMQSGTPTAARLLFPNLDSLRPLQEAIDSIPDAQLAQPCLAIIEAPTGEGKTEAALALAHRIAQSQGTDELYCALPTMATSNQMFTRVQTYLRDNLRLDGHVAIVHGQAFLIEDELRIEPMDNGDGRTQRESTEWFSSKKRALLAPFGVGTIDQSELAALNVRHNMLRLIGLAGKVVILDEVHAYDTYMSTIIERLLQWLAVMGTSVILLSATLPIRQRRSLTQAYGASDINALPDSYPSLIVVNRDQAAHVQSPEAWQPLREIHVESMNLGVEDADAQTEAQARWLINSVAEGGCACWICNTVARAQQLFDSLVVMNPGDITLNLLHARFPLDQRQHIETELANTYGRNGSRPNKGIVIGTQVLEQSLDLDFDVMVSDLAPIDLVLQRAGRLHRHARTRPSSHAQARLWIHTVLNGNDSAGLGIDALIYDEYLLRQTWRVLSLPRLLSLPRDYRPLVEAVYGGEPLSTDPLFEAWEKLQVKRAKERQTAQERLLPLPDAEDSFVPAATGLVFDEDENSTAWRVAQTRLGEESINIVPMERLDEHHAKVILMNGESVIVNLHAEASREMVVKLLRRNMRISNKDAITGIRTEALAHPCRLFTESALLRGYYPLYLKDGRASFSARKGSLNLCLHPVLGLVIEKQGVPRD